MPCRLPSCCARRNLLPRCRPALQRLAHLEARGLNGRRRCWRQESTQVPAYSGIKDKVISNPEIFGLRRIIVLAFKNASFCLFENLFFVGIERHKRIHLSTKWVQLGRTLTSLFASVYAGETLVLSTVPLAAR